MSPKPPPSVRAPAPRHARSEPESRPAPRSARRVPTALLVVLAVAVLAGGVGYALTRDDGGSDGGVVAAGEDGTDGAVPVLGSSTTVPETTTTEATTTTIRQGPPSNTTTMAEVSRITGDISPKSVVANGHGIVFAQNMMYTHTVTAYGPDGALLATIPDSVDLAQFGIEGHPGISRGAPVETAFTSDGRYAYVSNYSMYGEGFGPEGADACSPGEYDDSFTYRIDTESMAIDQVIAVGSVPKYVAVTPDDSTVLVTNWCSFDMSIIDAATATEVARVPIGRYPRGIVVSPDSRTAYVAVMGGGPVVAVDIASRAVRELGAYGSSPRHLLLSPDGRFLYVSHNRSGDVARVDTTTGAATHTVVTGSQPRSMAISSDGTAIYVANYDSSTVTKLDATTMEVLDEHPTDHHPIGITYEPTTRSVWIAAYGGSIQIFSDG